MFALIASDIGAIIDTGALVALIFSIVLGVAFLTIISIMIIKRVKYLRQMKHNEQQWAEYHANLGKDKKTQ